MLVALNKKKKIKVSKPINLLKGKYSLKFIVCESKEHTVYAGDSKNNSLIVINKDKRKPKFIDMLQYQSKSDHEDEIWSGTLMKDDSLLIVAY